MMQSLTKSGKKTKGSVSFLLSLELNCNLNSYHIVLRLVHKPEIFPCPELPHNDIIIHLKDWGPVKCAFLNITASSYSAQGRVKVGERKGEESWLWLLALNIQCLTCSVRMGGLCIWKFWSLTLSQKKESVSMQNAERNHTDPWSLHLFPSSF